MNKYIIALTEKFSVITNGYKEMELQAKSDFADNKAFDTSFAIEAYHSDSEQVRMYAVFLLGYLSTKNTDTLLFLKKEVSKDKSWRVQEILAKAFDEYCKNHGYKNSLNTIDEWIQSNNPNTRRAVTEGLRIWTSRDYFKTNPREAIRRLSALKQDESEYVRKSVGNALRDISKKYPALINDELKTWSLDNREIKQVYKLASKFLSKYN